MRDMTFRIAVTCGLVLFALQGLVVAQQKSADPPPPIKTSITIDSDTLSADKPVIVTVTIENISDREIELELSCWFDLNSLSKEAVARKYPVRGDSYWGPVNISNSTPTELEIIDIEKQKQGIVVGRVPKVPLQLAKNETRTFKVDLTKVLWNDSILSGWPSENLFQVVPKGSYSLTFKMRNQGAMAKSNAVEVSVK